MTFVLVLCPFFLFGCVCQPKINEYDDDDDVLLFQIPKSMFYIYLWFECLFITA